MGAGLGDWLTEEPWRSPEMESAAAMGKCELTFGFGIVISPPFKANRRGNQMLSVGPSFCSQTNGEGCLMLDA